MNNKRGQILVMFILLLPIMLMLLGLIVDTGLLFIEKRNIDDNIKHAIRYCFESKLDEAQLQSAINELLQNNIKEINDLQINISNDYIKINVDKNFTSAFSVLFGKDFYDINSTYIGYISAGKLVIEKE